MRCLGGLSGAVMSDGSSWWSSTSTAGSRNLLAGWHRRARGTSITGLGGLGAWQCEGGGEPKEEPQAFGCASTAPLDLAPGKSLTVTFDLDGCIKDLQSMQAEGGARRLSLPLVQLTLACMQESASKGLGDKEAAAHAVYWSKNQPMSMPMWRSTTFWKSAVEANLPP